MSSHYEADRQYLSPKGSSKEKFLIMNLVTETNKQKKSPIAVTQRVLKFIMSGLAISLTSPQEKFFPLTPPPAPHTHTRPLSFFSGVQTPSFTSSGDRRYTFL